MPEKMILLICLLMSFRIYAINKVVYGVDNRVDYHQFPDESIKKFARSTAAMIPNTKISQGWWDASVEGGKLSDNGVCSSELFADQLAVANCSGFLVAPNIIATAGHCMRSSYDCDRYSWVFDYYQENASGDQIKVPKGSIYSCAEIIKTELDSYSQNDFALVRLEREVDDREPLSLRTSGKIPDHQSIIVMGYPSGLPLKIAAGANVRSNDDDIYFRTNLDTFGGNSGSAVINAQTGLVEGILVRGEQDYSYDYSNSCQIVNTCDEDACRGEDVTRIKSILVDLAPFMQTSEEPSVEVGSFIHKKSDIGLEILDKKTSQYKISVPSIDAIEEISLKIEIAHTYIGDLKITLVHPGGNRVVLRDRKGGSQDDLEEEYDISSFHSDDSEGTWIVEIYDSYNYDQGELESLEFTIVGELSEEEPEVEEEEEDCKSIWDSILRRPLEGIYQPLVNLCGAQFRSKLSEIMKRGHDALGYTSAREFMFSELDNEGGTVCSVYSSQCVDTIGIPSSSLMNTEHSWPQSLGATGVAKSDLHHLFPVMSKMNSRRSNYPFCEVDHVIYDGGSRLGSNDQSSRCFEPKDEHKGDLARAMLYFSVRYNKSLDEMQESFFRKWSEEDLPSGKELARHLAISHKQGNRNPFVEYPAFVKLIDNY